MSTWEDDHWDWYRDQAETEFIEQSLRNLSIDSARGYLGKHGDAVDARVKACLREAHELTALKRYAPALVSAATAVELMIRFMLVRPLVQGAFLSDEWAAILAGRVTNGRTAEDRELLPAILRQWGVDLGTVKLDDGTTLWETVVSKVWPKRNKIVHAGATATEAETIASIKAAESLMANVVRVVAASLGFTLDKTGRWSEIRGTKGIPWRDGYSEWSQSFDPRSPFEEA